MRKLDLELDGIKEQLLILTTCVKQSYLDVLDVINEDNHRLAIEIIHNDAVINEMEDELNKKVIQIIALQAPVATDLRLLIATLKIANQLERIADYVVNIADYFIVFASECDDDLKNSIVEMINLIIMMLEETMIIIENPNLEQIKNTANLDRKIDGLYDQISDSLAMLEVDENITKYHLRTILIAKYLERAGDHITNVLESLAYQLDGNVYNFNSGSVKRQYLKKSTSQ